MEARGPILHTRPPAPTLELQSLGGLPWTQGTRVGEEAQGKGGRAGRKAVKALPLFVSHIFQGSYAGKWAGRKMWKSKDSRLI